MRSLNYLFLFGLALPLSGCEKYALDRQMEELCKKDGGLTVYENPTLPANRFDSSGKVIHGDKDPSEFELRYGPEYQIKNKNLTIKNGDPVLGEGQLLRFEQNLIRVMDKKTMVTSVTYARVGGDLIYYSHFSSKICPEPSGISFESTFRKRNQE